jgi:hypothetical protein
MGHYNSFLVRVWSDKGHNLVRGYIQHVGSEEIVHFIDWNKMIDFMNGHLDWRVGENKSDNAGSQSELPVDVDGKFIGNNQK